MRLTKAQKRLIDAMKAGMRLWLFGEGRFEMQGLPESRCFSPQERTVAVLIDDDLLRWKPYKNDTQRACGICELELICPPRQLERSGS